MSESFLKSLTCTAGMNRLVPARRDAILHAARDAAGAQRREPPVIERWDGKAAERIAAILCNDGTG